MFRPLGFEFSNPDGLHIGLRVFSACRIEDSFVSLTALTPQRRHLIVRLYGLSVLKALQAYTPLTRFRSCGYLAFVRNVTPVTHRLDYPTSLLLCFALWASSSRTPTGCTHRLCVLLAGHLACYFFSKVILSFFKTFAQYVANK